MKKITVKNLDSLGIEKLSRENLKNVTGGVTGCSMHGQGCAYDDQCCDGLICYSGVCGPGEKLKCPDTTCTHMDAHGYARTSSCVETTISGVSSCKCTTSVRSVDC